MTIFKCSLCNSNMNTFWKLDMENRYRKGSLEMHLYLCADCAEKFALMHDHVRGTINLRELTEAL